MCSSVAPLPIITSTWRVAFNWFDSTTAVTAENVMHFREGSTGVLALSAAIDSHVTAGMWQQTTANQVIQSLDLTPLDGSGLTQHFITGSGVKYSGDLSGGDYIPQGCMLVKNLTGVRGRSHRGRVYLPWVAESVQSNGTLTAANVASCTTAWNTFLAAMRADEWAPVVASYTLGTAEDTIAFTVEPKMATQRRRMHR